MGCEAFVGLDAGMEDKLQSILVCVEPPVRWQNRAPFLSVHRLSYPRIHKGVAEIEGGEQGVTLLNKLHIELGGQIININILAFTA